MTARPARAARPTGAAAFVRRFPALFHVTDPDALPGIARDGLLSAAGLAALYGVPEAERPALLQENRGRGHFRRLEAPGLPGATLRDQWMPDPQLSDCLRGAYAGRPGAWRRLINDHVFFWLSEAQAQRLARVNRAREQLVLRFDAAALLAAHAASAFTTPINSGIAAGMYGRPGSPRDEATFRPLSDYPRSDGRTPRELALRGGVPGAMRFRVEAG